MTLDEAALDDGLARVERARAWSPRTVSRLETLIRGADDTALFRVNPLTFADTHGLGADEAVDLFVHATAAGLFVTDWLLICPNCACAVANLAKLGPIEPTYHCPVCHGDTEAALDEFIAVYFTVSPAVRTIPQHRPQLLPAQDYLVTGRGVREGRMPDGVGYLDFIVTSLRATAFLEPGSTTELALTAEPGVLLGFSVDGDADMALTVDAAPARAQRLEVHYLGDRLEVDDRSIAPGPLTLVVRSAAATRQVFAVIQLQPGYVHPHLSFDPFLTGQRLLMTQSFRDLFRIDAAGRAEGIAIRRLALVFTDLQGSTALYQQVGDLNALQIVQEHFGLLREAAVAHGGCIVKTIGDAVMAAFATPRQAVEAAVAMLRATAEVAGHHAGAALVLKAGVHVGGAVAVTLNDQLDYFGQTVNAAARVQGLARAGEIVVSDEVLAAEGVAAAIAGLEVSREEAQVRGFARTITVHRLHPPG